MDENYQLFEETENFVNTINFSINDFNLNTHMLSHPKLKDGDIFIAPNSFLDEWWEHKESLNTIMVSSCDKRVESFYVPWFFNKKETLEEKTKRYKNAIVKIINHINSKINIVDCKIIAPME